MMRTYRNLVIALMALGYLVVGVGMILPHHRARSILWNSELPVLGVKTFLFYLVQAPLQTLPGEYKALSQYSPSSDAYKRKVRYVDNMALGIAATWTLLVLPLFLFPRSWVVLIVGKLAACLLLGIWHSIEVNRYLGQASAPLYGFTVFATGYTIVFVAMMLLPPRPRKTTGHFVVLTPSTTVP